MVRPAVVLVADEQHHPAVAGAVVALADPPLQHGHQVEQPGPRPVVLA